MMYAHFPVIAVMGLFLGAFLVEIFGTKNKYVRNTIVMFFVLLAAVLTFALIKPVMANGEIITYWMGNWEPVEGWAIGIGYEVDALGLFFGLFCAATFVLSAIYSFRYMDSDDHLGHYYTLFLMLCGGVLGLVFTGDLFNMFIMVEIITFASAALAAFRNYKFGALEAGFKYLVIGSVGSSMILFGVALIYLQTHTLNIAQIGNEMAGKLTPVTVLALGLLIMGFSVKAFIFPFHTPVVDSYATAPAPISMMFSGTVNKIGVLGLIRVLYSMFRVMDKTALQMTLVVIGMATMFIAVTCALAQHRLKRLLAYHSISQVGYVIMAIGLATPLGVTGGLFHALNHTVFKGLLFLCAGAVFYAAGTTNMDKLGGLSKKMPLTCACFIVGAFSISGIPPLNGFASKWMIYLAAYNKGMDTGNFLYIAATIVAVVTSVMTLASFIKVTQTVFFGQLKATNDHIKDVPLSMRIPMWIGSGLCVFLGVGYNFINKTILNPAMNAAFSADRYFEVMMNGAANASAGTKHTVELTVWDPILWLILFVIVFAAVAVAIVITRKSVGKVMLSGSDNQDPDGKYAVFFSGERSQYSHVVGSDMFWGFRKNFSKYFDVFHKFHNGNVNDYATYCVVGGIIITIIVFIFVR